MFADSGLQAVDDESAKLENSHHKFEVDEDKALLQ